MVKILNHVAYMVVLYHWTSAGSRSR